MSLENLIESLKIILAKNLVNEGEKLAEKKINFPAKSDNCQLDIHNTTWLRPQCHNLRFSGSIKQTPEEARSHMESLLKRIKKVRFITPRVFRVQAEVNWGKNSFMEEKNRGSFNIIEAQTHFFAHDPGKIRIGTPGKIHELEILAGSRGLRISATGEYRSLLPKIIKEIKPQLATVELSQADAAHWIEQTTGFKKKFLQTIFKPRELNGMVLVAGGPSYLKKKKGIVAQISIATLREGEKILGKSLLGVDHGEKSHVIYLTKTFFLKRKVLPAIQRLIDMANSLKAKTVLGQPLLTPAEAKTRLEEEIACVKDTFANPLLYGVNTHRVQRDMIIRLVEEYFGGDKFTIAFNQMDDQEYLQFLISCGFRHADKTEEEQIAYTIKEWYLFQFFCQSYTENPRDLIEKIRQWYTNSPPKTTITGKSIMDATRAHRLSIPENSTLTHLLLEERSRIGNNEISLKYENEDELHFWFRTTLTFSLILNLQKEVCAELGIQVAD